MATHADSLYAGIQIQSPVAEVWRLIQTPHLHERWDLRFAGHAGRAGPDETQPRRSRPAARWGFGLTIENEAESGDVQPGGGRALNYKFGSDDPGAFVCQGTGRWRCTPVSGAALLETSYDYDVRFGAAGRLFDRLVFRPLLGWATAWCFDRLRLWIEREVDPATALKWSIVHAVARLTAAFVWLYHGLVPKLLLHHPDELRQFLDSGLAPDSAYTMVSIAGWAEIAIAIVMLAFWRSRWPFVLTAVLMILALAGVASSSPVFLVAAFNPVTLNGLMTAIALIGCLSVADLPSARRCRRKPSQS